MFTLVFISKSHVQDPYAAIICIAHSVGTIARHGRARRGQSDGVPRRARHVRAPGAGPRAHVRGRAHARVRARHARRAHAPHVRRLGAATRYSYVEVGGGML